MKAKNGILRGEIKVKNGKLLKCKIELEDNLIKNIKITGDFFMYPEEKIEELEKMLKGIAFNKEGLDKKISKFFENVEIIGASKEDFVKVILEAR